VRWCVEIAGRRVHGTAKRIPLEVFGEVERPALLPVPPTPWELAELKKANQPRLPRRVRRLDRRAHVGARHGVEGRTLSRVHARRHPPPRRPGQRRTLTDDLPPDKVHFLLR
jgi:hypothetical protein